jgi:DNA-binding CsgD family transcriptional regulator
LICWHLRPRAECRKCRCAQHLLELAVTPASAGATLTNQLVQCLADGLSYKLAADQLGVSVNAVLFHIRNLYKKLGVNSKSEVVAMPRPSVGAGGVLNCMFRFQQTQE